MVRHICVGLLGLWVCGCATVSQPTSESGGTPIAVQENAQRQAAAPTAQTRELKRKIAVGRFTNVTRYGRTLLGTMESDPIANQAADIITNRLVETGRFIVIDRPSIELAARMDVITGADAAQLAGVDAIVVGAVTRFGRRDEGRTGFLSSTKRQVVEATVEARLVDVRTGRVFFTASGSGDASVEQGEVAGFGSRAAYDDTLNDKAVAAAVADLMSDIVDRLQARRWSTDVLQIRQDGLVISGGPAIGLAPGSRLKVAVRGEMVASPSTGALIELPGDDLAEIEIVSFFGADAETEGAVARIVRGGVAPTVDIRSLRVEEIRP
jgi:curli biogenesis system outer membrane secretion channel CsgG